MLLLTSLLLLLTTLLNAQVVRRSPRRDTSHLDTDDEGCVFDEQHHRHCLPRLVGVACRAGVPPFAQRLPLASRLESRVGAAPCRSVRGGSTSLATYLNFHPRLTWGERKEHQFFRFRGDLAGALEDRVGAEWAGKVPPGHAVVEFYDGEVAAINVTWCARANRAARPRDVAAQVHGLLRRGRRAAGGCPTSALSVDRPRAGRPALRAPGHARRARRAQRALLEGLRARVPRRRRRARLRLRPRLPRATRRVASVLRKLEKTSVVLRAARPGAPRPRATARRSRAARSRAKNNRPREKRQTARKATEVLPARKKKGLWRRPTA